MRKVYGCLLVALCLFWHSATAGRSFLDTLEDIKEDDLIEYSFRFFYTELQYTDSVTAFRSLERMSAIANDRNSCLMQTCATFLKGKYCFTQNANSKFKTINCIPFFDIVLNSRKCSEILYIEAQFFKGYTLTHTPDYSKGFEYIIRANEEAGKTGFSNFPNTFELYALLGNTFYSFADYENSLGYLLKAIKYQGTVEMRAAVDVYNTIALCYRQTGRYDSADYYFRYALQLANTAHVSDWIGIVSGNIGELLYRKNKLQEALPYLFRDVQISKATQQVASAANANLTIARIYLDLKKYDSAELILRNAEPLIAAANENRIFAGYYKNLFVLYKTKDERKAITFVDSFHYYQELAAKEMDVVVADRVKNKLETERFQASIHLLERENRWHRTERMGMIVIVVLMALIGWLIFRRIRQERKHSKKELHNARLLLDNYTATLKQKSRLLDEARMELENLSHSATETGADKEEVLRKLQQTTILTEEDWKEFKTLFGQIHTQFFSHLKKYFPNLTNAEIRLLALSKLGLSTNEKASALGISPDSVRKTKLRLYKKLGITEEEMLQRME